MDCALSQVKKLGARTGGATKQEALTHLHNILLMILLELESKGLAIRTDEIVQNGVNTTINTGAERVFPQPVKPTFPKKLCDLASFMYDFILYFSMLIRAGGCDAGSPHGCRF